MQNAVEKSALRKVIKKQMSNASANGLWKLNCKDIDGKNVKPIGKLMAGKKAAIFVNVASV